MTDYNLPLLGIDTSSWTGTPSAGSLIAAGLTFVICKATESMGYNNPTYQPTRRETEAAGLVFGAYHYVRAGNGAAQCDRFLDFVGDLTGCLAALDVEDGADYSTVVAFVGRWRERMGAAPLLLYTGKWWWCGVAGNPDGASLTPYLWDSNYITGSGSPRDLLAGVTPDYFPAYGGWGLSNRVIRQYSSIGTPMAGGGSTVDCNVFYGSRDELLALTVSGGAPSPPIDTHPGARTIAVGDSGPDVAELQRCLGIASDGVYGVDTKIAVQVFQETVGLTTDGICGAATWVALVYGSIGDLYRSPGMAARMGVPLVIESPCADGAGRYVHFANSGSIYWYPATDPHEVHGAIRLKWEQFGWEGGTLGYPISNEMPCSDGRGRYNHFERGSIYWTPSTGGHEVHGAIRDAWAGTGWEGGPWGYPTSDEYAAPNGRGQDFQRCTVNWNAGTQEVSTL